MKSDRMVRVFVGVLLTLGCGAGRADQDSAPSTGTTPSAATRSSAPTDVEALRAREAMHIASTDLGLVSIPKAQAYLDQLLTRVQAAGPQPSAPARVLIRAKLSYNAASTPTGLILIDLGWLKSIDSEAELVALLAHEYGHILRDHLGLKNRLGSASHVASILGKAVGIATKSNNFLSINAAMSGWSDLLLPRWNREQEFEADDVALEITQAMGYPFVPSVRAFLERVESVEQKAAPADPKQAQTTPLLTDSHPPTAERISRMQEAVRGRPRQRPAERADGWTEVRNSEEFLAAEKEYVLAVQVHEILNSGRHDEIRRLLPEIAKLPLPLKSAAALTMMASIEPDPKKRLVWLDHAIRLPDTAFMAYGILAITYRDGLGQIQAAVDALDSGLDRFDSPRQHWPQVIEFQRVTRERLEALPKDQRSLEINLLTTKLAFRNTGLLARCSLDAEFVQACTAASRSDQERRATEAAQKAAEDAMARKATQKIESLFKKR